MATILVTGANRGLGIEFVEQYLNEGNEVIAVSYTHLTLPTNREV